MKKLRAAIMGCGRISVCYEDAFNRLSDQVELVCAIDIDEERTRQVFKLYMQGETPEAIAKICGIPVEKVREIIQ